MPSIFVHEALSVHGPGQDELAEAGREMRDAIAGDLSRIGGLTVTVAISEQEGLDATGPWIRTVTPLPGEEAVEFVRRQSRLHDLCWVVAPETGGLLSSLHEATGDARWIGCSGPAIRLTSSKRATCAALAEAGILTPLAFAAGHDGPWIVKPDDGAGSLDTRRHDTREAAEADLRQRQGCRQSAVAEPFVPGEPLSISLIAGPVLARPIAFNRQRLHLDGDGTLHDLGVQAAAIAATDPRAATLHALATRVSAAIPGLRGYVGIDVVWNEREGPVVIEVNPRVTCAYVGLSALLRRNLAADILAVHAHCQVRKAAAHASP